VDTNPRTRPETDDMVPENSLYRLPSVAQKMVVTPDMASDWLSFRNHPLNRPLSSGITDKYQRMMRDGTFREGTPEGYIFDTEGKIISGQHRLKAQANGNYTLEMWIFPDEPRDIFDVVDQGYKRTAAHLLRVKYATNLASGARILRALGGSDRFTAPGYNRLTTTEIVQTFREWPELTWYGAELFAAYHGGDVPMGPHAAVMAQAARTVARDRIPEWLAQVAEGVGLNEDDPARRLRKRFHDGVTTRKGGSAMINNYSLTVKAWNAFVRGDDITVLRHAINEPIPDVEGHPRALLIKKEN
jgi:hypothetical protein